MDVSVIIVNYCTENLIIDCVKSIIDKTEGICYEIIIVDNASPHNSISILEKEFENDKTVRCLQLKENIGFGRANNAGYELSSGKYVFCLNPDTKLKNNAINILSNYLDNNPDVGACGGNLFQSNGEMCTSHRMLYPSIMWEFSFLSNYLLESIRYGKNRKFNTEHHAIDVATLSGADIMIRRSIIEEIGFYDPNFFMYYEDTDLCYRVSKNNFLIRNIPDAKIYHYEGKSTKNLEKKAGFNFDGRETFYNKHYSKVYHVIADAIYGTAVFLRILALIFRKDSNRKYWTTLFCLLTKKYFKFEIK